MLKTLTISIESARITGEDTRTAYFYTTTEMTDAERMEVLDSIDKVIQEAEERANKAHPAY